MDVYSPGFNEPIPVGDLPEGGYKLTGIVDPDETLQETCDLDNSEYIIIRLRSGHVTVEED